ncbi:cyclase family protein [Pseudonocardia sp. CA-107938]|uniref:cyclase family protein n=1 Tax=Pseudonocardia sp. CA-107938 TaxID=3240021 RepID=UPI003D90CF2C
MSANGPTEDELRRLFAEICNWGRWGAEDELGTINLITPAVRARAAATVTEGLCVSCARAVELDGYREDGPGDEWREPPVLSLHLPDTGQPGRGVGIAVDRFAITAHGKHTTHLDALCHITFDGRMYNGRTAEHLTSAGATAGDVALLADRLCTRGVLLDIAALRGGYARPGEPVRTDELLEAERAGATRVGPGDALLIHLGRDARWRAEGTGVAEPQAPPMVDYAGLHPECLRFFRERDIAVLVSDIGHDQVPPVGGIGMPVHIGALVHLGLPLIDGAMLEGVVRAADRLQRREFLFTAAPPVIPGATSALVNPMALF